MHKYCTFKFICPILHRILPGTAPRSPEKSISIQSRDVSDPLKHPFIYEIKLKLMSCTKNILHCSSSSPIFTILYQLGCFCCAENVFPTEHRTQHSRNNEKMWCIWKEMRIPNSLALSCFCFDKHIFALFSGKTGGKWNDSAPLPIGRSNDDVFAQPKQCAISWRKIEFFRQFS